MNEVALSVVVPVYDEEESLGRLHAEISEALKSLEGGYELLLVDDGSRDRSFEVCRELNAKDPQHVRAIRFRRNFGQTAAMAAGFHAARGRVVACLDADLQNDPADIPRMLEEIEKGYDVVSGWRFDRKDKFVSRRLPSIVANAIIAYTTGVHIHDYGCTLKLYRREVVERMDLYGELHRFLPALASWSGAEVKEMKVNHRARQFGKSKVGIGRTLNVMLDLITVKFLLSSSTKPMRVLGKWGFFLLTGGAISAVLAIVKKITSGNMADSPWMFLAITLFLGGLQLISMGLLAEIGVRTYFESQNKRIYAIRETIGVE